MDIQALANQYSSKTPEDILRLALESFDNVAISFSGAEDVVLVDMASRIQSDVRVFSLDTGRLHPETYRFLDRVRERYAIRFEALSPDAMAVERLVREKGLFSFYQDGHQECCGIRKVGPLRRRLQSLDAWVTGQRKDQSLATRATIAVVERDAAFSTPEHALVKFNPLANWTAAEVWDYIRGERRTLQRAPRARLREHRLRALHARRPALSAGARRPVVVGRRRRQGVRAPQGERGRRPALRACASRWSRRSRPTAARAASAPRSSSGWSDLQLLGRIDRVVVADERDPDSEGMQLAGRYNVDWAPFFIVEDDSGGERIYTSFFRFLKEVLGQDPRQEEETTEMMRQNPDLDFL